MTWFPLLDSRWPSRHWVGCATLIGGNRIFARISPDGDRSVPPILMLHGLVVSGSYFRPVARHLDETYRIYIPDLPGVGHSDAQRHHDLGELVDLLDAWMDAHTLERVIVVGNSLGCQVGTLLAVRYPHRVASLVMVAPTSDPSTCGPIGMIVRGLIDIPRERFSLWRIWIPDFFLTGPVRAVRSLMLTLRDPQLERLPLVTQPVVAVAGERDPICPVPWVRRFSELVGRGTCVVVPAAAHAMNYSAPGDLARVISELVERR
ncbi:MAG TPA: alpha/beta hydrolase [Thermomicrobiales bacterium]|nr:alpha/beta hydrolase [Thermomicrobiales bacterium]